MSELFKTIYKLFKLKNVMSIKKKVKTTIKAVGVKYMGTLL